MKKLNGLPVYTMSIDENDNTTGVEFISLVDFPAIMVDWVAMNNDKKIKLYAADQDKQIVTGPAMIPDLPIYRADEKMGEYYVAFEKSEIEKIARKFNKEQRTLGINFQHEANSQVSNCVIVEQWFISDTNNDKSKSLGFDLPVGTWMVSVYFADKTFWDEEIKTGKVRGFSIEGFLNLQMNKIKDANMKNKFNAVDTVLGSQVFVDGDVAVDSYVYSVEPSVALIDGKKAVVQYPIYDNIVELKDGTILTLENGKIVVVEQKTAAPVANNKQTKVNMEKTKLAEIKTTDGVTLYTTAETFVEGSDVTMDDGNGNQVPAADGDYILENGATITVANGKITAVVEADVNAEAEKPVETEQAKDLALSADNIKQIEGLFSEWNKSLEERVVALEKQNTDLKTQNEEMKAKFSNLPGTVKSATEKKDNEIPVNVKMNLEDKVNALRALKTKIK